MMSVEYMIPPVVYHVNRMQARTLSYSQVRLLMETPQASLVRVTTNRH